MFKKYFFYWALVWMCLVLSLVFFFLDESFESSSRYRSLLSDRISANEKMIHEEKTTSQLRQNISKQILYTYGGKRLQLNLFGTSSDLTYSKKKNGIVESIQGLSCRMQGDESWVVDSGVATVDEKEIHLAGEVKLKHALGSIEAKQFSLSAMNEGKPAVLRISEDVRITFHGGGELFCENAEIDYEKMEGVFTGKEDSPVIYKERGELQDVDIKADKMVLNFSKDASTEERFSIQEIVLSHHVTGEFRKINSEKVTDHISFSCQKGRFDLKKGVVNLQEDVVIKKGDDIIFRTSHECVLGQNLKEHGKRTLQYMKAPQDSECVFIQNNSECTLHCPGVLDWDCENNIMHLEGTSSEKQVHLEEAFGSFYSDKVTLEYDPESREPHTVLLEGNVLLQNRFDKVTGIAASPLHKASADKVEYHKGEDEIILSAFPGGKVLMVDEVNHMQIKASELKVTYHESRPLIQGKGDVRFTLIGSELNRTDFLGTRKHEK